jgi:hypothetical protein
MVADPPVMIDLTGGGGVWPAFTLSGVTGVSAANLNVTYQVQPYNGMYWHFKASETVEVREETTGEWMIDDGTARFSGYGTWPWTVTEWESLNDGEGTPVFARKLAAPGAIDLNAVDSAVTAALSTNLTGSNNDLTFTSLLPGRLGNDVTVRFVNPGAINAPLSVNVSGRDITVNLATNGSGVITSTAAQVRAAVAAHAEATALVTLANKAGNDGSGVVTAMGVAALGGGSGGLPLPPVVLTL